MSEQASVLQTPTSQRGRSQEQNKAAMGDVGIGEVGIAFLAVHVCLVVLTDWQCLSDWQYLPASPCSFRRCRPFERRLRRLPLCCCCFPKADFLCKRGGAAPRR